MLLNIFLILIGGAIVLWGADRLTEGAVAIAQRMKIPQMIIGLTVVAIGTSMPELSVSLTSAIRASADLAVANVVGSNIFNALGIVGVAAIISPMTILRNTVRKDIPFALVSTLLLVLLCVVDGELSRLDAILLFVLFICFMYITLQGAKHATEELSIEDVHLPMKTWLAIFWLLVGLGSLVGGSTLFVKAASSIAKEMGVSEAVIGLTIVAIGTSLPELATSVVSARKGQSGIAIGNVIGSNVFNILFILGTTGMIKPMHIADIQMLDYIMLIVSMMFLWLFSYTRLVIQRWEGGLLCTIFIVYLVWLVVQVL